MGRDNEFREVETRNLCKEEENLIKEVRKKLKGKDKKLLHRLLEIANELDYREYVEGY